MMAKMEHVGNNTNGKKVHKSSGTDDKKLQTALKKLNVQPIQAIEEVNMFKSDGNVIHFSAPKGTSRPLPARMLCTRCVLWRTIANKPAQFTLQYHRTPSPSTATARTRSLPSSFPASSTSSVPTRSRRCANSPRATRACKRRRARTATRRKMMMMRMTTTSQISLLETTSSQRPRSSKRLTARD
jgi:hypothetical protein